MSEVNSKSRMKRAAAMKGQPLDSLVDRAREFATAAHGNQVRKYGPPDVPYTGHLAEVAATVAEFGGSPAQVAAAWLHDTVEDTPVTLAEVEAAFGSQVALYVKYLTDPTDGSPDRRAVRRAAYAAHVARGPEESKLVKMADLLSNSRDIADADPKFARVYLPELAAMLKGLAGVNDALYVRVENQIKAGMMKLLLKGPA